MAVKKIIAPPIMSAEQEELSLGKILTAEDCKTLITYDADIYDKESGKCLAKFRKGIIPISLQRVAYENLLKAATSTDSRGMAGGKDEEDNRSSGLRVRKDGTTSKQTIAKNFVNSGIAGFYDRSVRFPNCRLTAFTRHHFENFKQAYPIVKYVDNKYKELMPEYYKKQRTIADKTSKDFVIPDTSFTTVTVNKNYITAAHRDSGDFKEGFGNLVALREGKYTGCYLTLVRWGIGFDMQRGDLLLMDVHKVHGNTPMVSLEPGATRLSLVMYYRENMYKCGTAEEELHRVRNRKRGDKL
jgi:hypothetical protein